MKKTKKQKNLNKQLWPLYIGFFMQWTMFWFSIEKPFMMMLGFDASWITIYVAVFSAVILIMEFPSGILADRWSRKGTMILSSVALLLACVVGSISNNIPSYLLLSVLWGIFVAFQSGTLEAIIYDGLVAVNGNAARYEREYSKLDILSSSAMIIGAASGGLIGQYIGLREAYMLSIPAVIISIIFISGFKEPKLKKSKAINTSGKYLKTIVKIITDDKKLLLLTLSLILIALATNIIAEVRQLWMSALSIPILFFGATSIASSAAYGFGSFFSRYMKNTIILSTCLIASSITLLVIIYSRSAVITIAAHFLTITFLYGASIVLTHKLLNSMPPSVRASSASTVSMVRQLLLIPIVILYGNVATATNVFRANWILFAVVALAIAFHIATTTLRSRSSALEKIN